MSRTAASFLYSAIATGFAAKMFRTVSSVSLLFGSFTIRAMVSPSERRWISRLKVSRLKVKASVARVLPFGAPCRLRVTGSKPDNSLVDSVGGGSDGSLRHLLLVFLCLRRFLRGLCLRRGRFLRGFLDLIF